MSIRIRRPEPEALRPLLDAGRADSLTYEPVGVTALATAPPGYRMDRSSTSLGHGDAVFAKAVQALKDWQVHRGSGLVVLAEGPPVSGAVVAMCAPLPLGFIDVVCRVVDVTDADDQYGFAYGTLSVHPERGEESFTVVREGDGDVSFHIVAVSRPRQMLASAFPSAGRMLQRAATRRYHDAMRIAATT